MQKEFDVIVVGAGTAGLTAFHEARRHTKKVLLIDRGPLGTTCARVGCMPSKALIQFAHDLHRSRLLMTEGLVPENSLVDLAAVMKKVRGFRDHFVEPMVRKTENLGEQFLRGDARFTGPSEVIVDGKQRLKARSIILATGSRPLLPAGWPRNHPRIYTSDSIFDLENLPQRWAVAGLGPIGLELGQALAYLGLDVFGYDLNKTIGGLAGSELNDLACDIFQSDMTLDLGHAVDVQDRAGHLEVIFKDRSRRVDAVLAALGRRPNLDDIDLKATGCAFDENGKPIMEENSPQLRGLPIYLAGDVDGLRPILHEAADDGINAARLACDPTAKLAARRTPLAIVFTHPGIATIGSRKAESGATVTGRVTFDDQGRAKIMRANQGAAHLHCSAVDGRLIGAELLAPDAEHLAHLFAFAVQRRLTVHDMLELPYYHPTVEEGLKTALRDAVRQLQA